MRGLFFSKILNQRVQSYREIVAWKERAIPFLKENEAWNNLFWQIIQKREKSAIKGWLGNVFCQGSISLAAMHTPSNYLLLSQGNLNAIEALAKYADHQNWKMDGLSGPENLVNHYLQCRGKGRKKERTSSKRVYKLFKTRIKTSEQTLENYKLDVVKNIDWPKARIWAQQFALESDPPLNLSAISQMAKQMYAERNLFMLTDLQNHPCAMAGFGRSTDRYRVINMVYVPKDCRRLGIGRELITQITLHAQEKGYDQCLLFSEWTGNKNLYHNMGCKYLGKFMEHGLS